MVKRAPRDDSNDRGDMIVGWLAKIVVVIGVIGVIGYDGVTAIQAQVTTRDQATSAATAGQANFVNTHNVQSAYQAAVADAHASNGLDSITPANFVVANDGTVTLKLTRPVHTLVAHYLGISAATSASATGVARPGS